MSSEMEITFVFLLAMFTRVMSDSSFTVNIDIDGHPLCSMDPPSANVSLTQPSSSYPIPFCALCGWQCKKTPNCTGFNLKCDNRTCELYFYQTSSLTNIAGCFHYSVCTTELDVWADVNALILKFDIQLFYLSTTILSMKMP